MRAKVAISPAELLQQAITAAKTGQKETARHLLTQVVEQDENNASAWLWLSGVVDSLDDKQVCLENVLALDPNNQAARKGLDWIRDQKEKPAYTPPLISESRPRRGSAPLSPAAAILYSRAEPEPEPEPPPPPAETAANLRGEWGEPLPQATLDAMQEFDNELLCPYCAAPTEEDDKHCKACKGDLWTHTRLKPEPSSWFWLLLGYLIFNAVVNSGLLYVIIQFAMGYMRLKGQAVTLAQLLSIYVGLPTVPPNVSQMATQLLAPWVFWVMVTIVLVQLIEVVLIYMRSQPMYWFLVGISVLNMVGSLAGAAVSPFVLVGTVFSAAPVYFLLRIGDDFMMRHDRLWCAPDKSLKGHNAFYQRGREHARKKMWALAALHFRRAVAGAPNTLAYYMALATAYVALKRYDRADQTVQKAQMLAPDSPKVQELANLITSKKSSPITA